MPTWWIPCNPRQPRKLAPSAGVGVVQALAGPTKIEVLFGAERKTLVHARK